MTYEALGAKAGLVVVSVLLLVGWAAGTADAATYTVWSCRGPDWNPISTQAWSEDSPAGGATEDTCPSGGFLRARLQSQNDNVAGRVRGYRFVAPSGTTIAGYRVHMFAATEPSLIKEAFEAGIGASPGPLISQGCLTAGCEFGHSNSPSHPENLVTASELKSGGLFAGVRCVSPLACLGQNSATNFARLRLFRSEVEVRDEQTPVVGSVTGTLPAASQPVSGTTTIGAETTDEGGGVASVALLVDGVQVAQSPACPEPYSARVPCPLALESSFEIDTAALAAGSHSAQLRAIDAAGNSAHGQAVAFTVDSAPPPPEPPPPGPPPASPPPQIAVLSEPAVVRVVVPVAPKLVKVEVSRARIAIEGNGRISGLVKAADGSPVSGARVIVRSRPFGVKRAKLRLERTLKTASDGRFSMAAIGASRLISLDVDDTSHRAEEPAEVRLMQRLSVEATQRGKGLRNGSVMTLHADVDGAGRGAGGKAALIQAIVEGRWATVESLTLDDEGALVWRYQFRGTTRPAIYRFRVRVPSAGDVWPWPTTDSPVLKVRVRR